MLIPPDFKPRGTSRFVFIGQPDRLHRAMLGHQPAGAAPLSCSPLWSHTCSSASCMKLILLPVDAFLGALKSQGKVCSQGEQPRALLPILSSPWGYLCSPKAQSLDPCEEGSEQSSVRTCSMTGILLSWLLWESMGIRC